MIGDFQSIFPSYAESVRVSVIYNVQRCRAPCAGLLSLPDALSPEPAVRSGEMDVWPCCRLNKYPSSYSIFISAQCVHLITVETKPVQLWSVEIMRDASPVMSKDIFLSSRIKKEKKKKIHITWASAIGHVWPKEPLHILTLVRDDIQD